MSEDRIPIKNLWLLMLYASKFWEQSKVAKKHNVEENPDDIANLVAEILCQCVEQRLMRNLSFGYQNKVAVLDRLRGRIDLLYTESRQLLSRAKVCCRFEELTVDTPRNRYVRAALQHLASLKQTEGTPQHKCRLLDIQHKCRLLAMRLDRIGVGQNKPSNYSAKSERFGLHDAADRMMLYAADFAFSLALPVETDGDYYLVSADKDERWLRTLFEKAVCGFYYIKLKSTCKVKSEEIKWKIDKKISNIERLPIPKMKTDITIEKNSSHERLIIDTKFTKITTPNHWTGEEGLHSSYIYQIYAYVRSQEDSDLEELPTTGMLLHPTVGLDYDESVTIQGHEFKFCTVNLGDEAKNIAKRLLDLLPDSFKEA